MKVDFNKVSEIVLRDKEGKMVDRFVPISATVKKDKINGNTLEFQKRV
jgi:hypothetical protein